jgi:hypothetical protein
MLRKLVGVFLILVAATLAGAVVIYWLWLFKNDPGAALLASILVGTALLFAAAARIRRLRGFIENNKPRILVAGLSLLVVGVIWTAIVIWFEASSLSHMSFYFPIAGICLILVGLFISLLPICLSVFQQFVRAEKPDAR